MGCAGIDPVDAPAKSIYAMNLVPIPYEKSNSYVDQYPIFVIMKLKDKFDMHCKPGQGGMRDDDFKKLYSHLALD